MATKPFLSDARMRGNFNQWMDKQARARYQTPGIDHNMTQHRNALGGWMNQTKPHNKTGSEPYQDFYRNRSNEQAGMPRPAAPATANPPRGPRRL